MIEAFENLSELEQFFAVVALFAGVWQLVLFLALIVHGGTITLWPGLVCLLVVTGLILA